MKIAFLFILLATALSFSSRAQSSLSGTRWIGVMNVPNPDTCILSFQKDTAVLSFAEKAGEMPQNTVLEIMIYTSDNGTFTLRKVSGGSPCDNKAVGKYKFEIKDDKMLVTVVQESCDARGQAWPMEALKRVR